MTLSRWVTLFAVTLLFSGTILYLLMFRHAPPADESSQPTNVFVSQETLPRSTEVQYIVLFDAGSSGSRVHVHSYQEDGVIPTIEPSLTKKLKPGLSSYAKNPSRAGASLLELIEFAKEHIPMNKWRTTPLHLMATAGLRSVKPHQAEAVLENVRDTLSATPFLFDRSWARIISGTQEGINGWLATNYLLGVFHRQVGQPLPQRVVDPVDPQEHVGNAGAQTVAENLDDLEQRNAAATGKDQDLESFGVIEMGGASLQVTFAPVHFRTNQAIVDASGKAPPQLNIVRIAGKEYKLYSHSYLNYGLEAAQELFQHSPAIVDHVDEKGNPCYPKSLRHSSVGDFDTCTSLMVHIMDKTEEACQHPRKSCSFNGVYQPPFSGEPFIAIENFYYTSTFFSVNLEKPVASGILEDLRTAGRAFCSQDWHNITAKFPDASPGDLIKYCFSSAYIPHFLEHGLGLPADSRLTVAREIEGRAIDWALGAVLFELLGRRDPSALISALPDSVTSATGPSLFVHSVSGSVVIWGSFILVPLTALWVLCRRIVVARK